MPLGRMCRMSLWRAHGLKVARVLAFRSTRDSTCRIMPKAVARPWRANCWSRATSCGALRSSRPSQPGARAAFGRGCCDIDPPRRGRIQARSRAPRPRTRTCHVHPLRMCDSNTCRYRRIRQYNSQNKEMCIIQNQRSTAVLRYLISCIYYLLEYI